MVETGRGGSPRVSEMFNWQPELAIGGKVDWGCPKCGNYDSRVHDSDHDEEGVRVRRRICTRCGEFWETEERRIETGSFFARAMTRRYAAFRKKRYTSRACTVCPERYMSGKYLEHTQESEAHAANVARKQRRIRERERRYSRLHARASREIKYAKRGKALCQRCGELYPLSVRNPARTHRGSSEQHKQVVKEEAKARKDRRRRAARRAA